MSSLSCPLSRGYPDFVEDVDGSIFITETNKQSALCHRIDSGLADMLWAQDSITTAATAGRVLSFGEQPAGAGTVMKLPAGAGGLPNMGKSTSGVGVTIELWVKGHAAARPGQTLFSTSPSALPLTLNVSHRPAGPVALTPTP